MAPDRPPQRPPIPLTVIGGFLGSGKTTLLNALLRRTGPVRYAVLVNDFGALNIDAELVAAHGGDTVRLTNGCICCAIGDNLAMTLAALVERPDTPQHILIEASGVADPGPIAGIARLDRALRLDGVIVLVDAEGIRRQAADRYMGDTVLRQLTGADILVLNKTDLVPPQAVAEVADWLRRQAPGARIVPSVHADLPVALLLGVAHGGEATMGKPGAAAQPGHGDVFRTFAFQSERPVVEAALRAALDALPESVIRAKGVLASVEGGDRRRVLQMVGRRVEIADGGAWSDIVPGVRMVILGTPEMPDEAVLRALLDAVLAAG